MNSDIKENIKRNITNAEITKVCLCIEMMHIEM